MGTCGSPSPQPPLKCSFRWSFLKQQEVGNLTWVHANGYSFCQGKKCCAVRLEIERGKCSRLYYSNSSATFHCPLEGDFVLKLNPGPADDQNNSAICSHCSSARRTPLSTRTRNPSNLITVNRVPQTKDSNTPLFLVNPPRSAHSTTPKIPVVSSSRDRRKYSHNSKRNIENLISVNCFDHSTNTQNHNKNKLSFCVMNVRCLNNKAGEFTDFVC